MPAIAIPSKKVDSKPKPKSKKEVTEKKTAMIKAWQAVRCLN